MIGTDRVAQEVVGEWRDSLGILYLKGPLNPKQMLFQVADEAGCGFVLKHVEHPERAGGVERQAAVLEYLQKAGVPVAPLVRSDQGKHFVECEGLIFTLSPQLPGGTYIAAEDLKRAHRNIGRAIGRLHHALKSYSEQIESWTMNLTERIFHEAVPVICEGLSPSEGEDFSVVMEKVNPEMRSAFEGLPLQYIHGDCHLSNILIYESDVSGFVDLDHLPTGPAVYDVGYALADMVKRKVGSEAETRGWRALASVLLAGYEETNKLSVKELNAIWPVMLAVQLLFTEFFLQQGNQHEARVNLEAFYWLAQHQEECFALAFERR